MRVAALSAAIVVLVFGGLYWGVRWLLSGEVISDYLRSQGRDPDGDD